MIKKSISTMQAMVKDLHNESQSKNLWPKMFTYWPLLEKNQLIKDVPVAQTDQGRYSLRPWLTSASNQPDNDTPFTRTRRQVQEVLETFQTTVSSRLLTNEDEDLCTHTSRLTDIKQYEILATSVGPEPFSLRVLEKYNLVESCRFLAQVDDVPDSALTSQLQVNSNNFFSHK